jgi:hypothetical protein
MDASIKQELHQLIDNCDNELLLEEAKVLLKQDQNVRDWRDNLTEEDKSLVMESEATYEKGNFISHKELMQRFEKWKKK